MVSSPDYKYIFIANPKTGSTTVEHYLREWDKSYLHNRYIDESGNIRTGIHGHIRPRDLKRIMAEKYDDYRVFIFIRNPYDKAVSAYHYYKQGLRKKIEFGKNKGNLSLVFNLILARLLPFSIWSLVKPMKSNHEYLTDVDGRVIVDYIGITENLSIDLKEIANELGLKGVLEERVGKSNTSKRDQDYGKYFSKKWHKKWFDAIHKRDILIYNEISETPRTYSWRGEKF